MSDVTATKKAVSHGYHAFMFYECLTFCYEGAFTSAIFAAAYKSTPAMCDMVCHYQFSMEYIPPASAVHQQVPNCFHFTSRRYVVVVVNGYGTVEIM